MTENRPLSLSLDSLTKRFGRQAVLNQASARFEGGGIYGVAGPNGCGKTVLLKCMCGLLPIDGGSVTLGAHAQAAPPKGSFGVVIETPGFLPQFSGYENLRMLARLSRGVGKEDVYAALDALNLTDVAKKKVGKYSLGMRQRLGIAQAIMGDPPVLLLDEPLNGLDQKSVETAYVLLKKLRAQGKIIILASHHKQDIELLCDRVLALNDGRLIPQKTDA